MSCPWGAEPTLVPIRNGLTLEVDSWGPGDGTPALFIHGGYGGPATTALGRPPWFDRVLVEGDPVRMIRYSRRNAGLSSYVLEPFGLADLATDAVQLLDGLGVDRSIVVGSSAGGLVALELALTHPERVQALALVNTGAAIMSTQPRGLVDPAAPGVLARVAEVVERCAILDDVERRGARAVFEERLHEIRDALVEQAVVRGDALGVDPVPLCEIAVTVGTDLLFEQWYGSILNWAAARGHDFHDRLDETGALGVPVLVLHGDADEVVPFEYGEHLHQAIVGSVLSRVVGGAHEITRDPIGAEALRRWLIEIAAGCR